MSNLLQNGAAWLGTQMKSAAGRTVKIRQGENIYDAVTAWHATVDYQVLDSEGFATSLQSIDWRFVAEDLPDGFAFREGDIIEETVGDDVRFFEAMPLGNQPCSEDADSSGVLLIVHTKRVQ